MKKILVVIAALAIWATGAYPPWKLSHSGVSNAAGNDWLFNEKHVLQLTPFATLRAGLGYSVDYGRLGIEWLIIAAIYGAALQLTAPAPPAAQKP